METILAARIPAGLPTGRALRSRRRRAQAVGPRGARGGFGDDNDSSKFELGSGWSAARTGGEKPLRSEGSYRRRSLKAEAATDETPQQAPVIGNISASVEGLDVVGSSERAGASSQDVVLASSADPASQQPSIFSWRGPAAGVGLVAAVFLEGQLHPRLEAPVSAPGEPAAVSSTATRPVFQSWAAPSLEEPSSLRAPDLRSSPGPDHGAAAGPSARDVFARLLQPSPAPIASDLSREPPPATSASAPPPPSAAADPLLSTVTALSGEAGASGFAGALAALPVLLIARAVTSSSDRRDEDTAVLVPIPLEPIPEVSAADALKRCVLNELEVAAACIPHPDKVDKGGEDAFGVIVEKGFVALADGVGGWDEDGVDPAAYSQALVANCVAARESGESDPLRVLEQAHARTKVLGSSTAVVVQMERGKARTAVVGDSGIVQCRSGSIIFASPPQQHRFNCPFQLADTDLVPEADTPACALTYDLLIEPGDFVVMATDGVFDNVFPEEIAQLCETYGTANRAVEAITVLAFQRSQDPQFLSPFALASRIDDQEEMLEFRKGDKSLRARLQELIGLGIATGGKPDDITCVVLQSPK